MAKVQEITQRIQSALRDANQDSWAEEVIWQAINEAERVVVIYRPDAAPVSAEFTCAPGIEQTLAALNPAPNRLLSVKYNRTGSVNGRSVRRVGIGDKDAINPDWRSTTPSTVIREFMHDEREPLIFYVSPPAETGAKLQISYSQIPTKYPAVVISTTETTVNDLYEPMLIEWAMYRLFGHDTEGAVNINRSQQHLANFQAMMGIKIQSEGQFSVKNSEFRN